MHADRNAKLSWRHSCVGTHSVQPPRPDAAPSAMGAAPSAHAASNGRRPIPAPFSASLPLQGFASGAAMLRHAALCVAAATSACAGLGPHQGMGRWPPPGMGRWPPPRDGTLAPTRDGTLAPPRDGTLAPTRDGTLAPTECAPRGTPQFRACATRVPLAFVSRGHVLAPVGTGKQTVARR
eukprot:gene16530-biopygen4618